LVGGRWPEEQSCNKLRGGREKENPPFEKKPPGGGGEINPRRKRQSSLLEEKKAGARNPNEKNGKKESLCLEEKGTLRETVC